MNVASLADVIRSKETADRPKDHATLPVLARSRTRLRPGNAARVDGRCFMRPCFRSRFRSREA